MRKKERWKKKPEPDREFHFLSFTTQFGRGARQSRMRQVTKRLAGGEPAVRPFGAGSGRESRQAGDDTPEPVQVTRARRPRCRLPPVSRSFRFARRQLEQRHADQLRLVQEVAQADRDQLVSQLQRELDKRQLQLSQAKEEDARLKESLNAMAEVR